MEKKQNTPPSLDDWNLLPLPIKLYIGWIIFKSVHWIKIEEVFIKRIRRIDLWLFPPLAFYGAYKSMMQIVPMDHPMALVTVLGSCFMSAVLVQLVVRPRKIFYGTKNK